MPKSKKQRTQQPGVRIYTWASENENDTGMWSFFKHNMDGTNVGHAAVSLTLEDDGDGPMRKVIDSAKEPPKIPIRLLRKKTEGTDEKDVYEVYFSYPFTGLDFKSENKIFSEILKNLEAALAKNPDLEKIPDNIVKQLENLQYDNKIDWKSQNPSSCLENLKNRINKNNESLKKNEDAVEWLYSDDTELERVGVNFSWKDEAKEKFKPEERMARGLRSRPITLGPYTISHLRNVSEEDFDLIKNDIECKNIRNKYESLKTLQTKLKEKQGSVEIKGSELLFLNNLIPNWKDSDLFEPNQKKFQVESLGQLIEAEIGVIEERYDSIDLDMQIFELSERLEALDENPDHPSQEKLRLEENLKSLEDKKKRLEDLYSEYVTIGKAADHVVYLPFSSNIEKGMNPEAMIAKMKALLLDQQNQGYSQTTKNCSTTVGDVLEAGAPNAYMKHICTDRAVGFVGNPQIVYNMGKRLSAAIYTQKQHGLRGYFNYNPIQRAGGYLLSVMFNDNKPILARLAAGVTATVLSPIALTGYVLGKVGGGILNTMLINPIKKMSQPSNATLKRKEKENELNMPEFKKHADIANQLKMREQRETLQKNIQAMLKEKTVEIQETNVVEAINAFKSALGPDEGTTIPVFSKESLKAIKRYFNSALTSESDMKKRDELRVIYHSITEQAAKRGNKQINLVQEALIVKPQGYSPVAESAAAKPEPAAEPAAHNKPGL